MARGVPWDQLPNRYEPKQKVVKTEAPAATDGEIVPHKFDPAKDLIEVGRRTLFGLVVSCAALGSQETFSVQIICCTVPCYCCRYRSVVQ